MTSDALQRVLEGCETLARHFPGTIVVKQAQSVDVCQPQRRRWFSFRDNGDVPYASEAVVLTEYRVDRYKAHVAGSPWEAITELERLLLL